MRSDVRDGIKIAGAPAVRSRVAFAGYFKYFIGIYAVRYFKADRFFFFFNPGSGAYFAFVFGDFAGAAAFMANGSLHNHAESGFVANVNLAGAVALLAG